MIKYLKFLLILSNVINFGQDSNYASFFPMQVGNYWQYEIYDITYTDTTFSGYEDMEILADTFINDKNYYKIKKYDRWDVFVNFSDSLVYYRFDSTYSNIIQYLLYENKDTLRFKFDCDPNETWDDGFFTYNGKDTISIFSRTKERILITQHRPNADFQYFYYSFAKGFGPNHYLDDESWSVQSIRSYILVYAKINGVEYGNFVSINNDEHNYSKDYSLSQNFPNPFNPFTTIKYSIPQSSHVKLIVYNTLGEIVKILVDKYIGKGSYSVIFNGSDLSSGIYYYKLFASQKELTKKFVLLK